jgi:hypothetical protein
VVVGLADCLALFEQQESVLSYCTYVVDIFLNPSFTVFHDVLPIFEPFMSLNDMLTSNMFQNLNLFFNNSKNITVNL